MHRIFIVATLVLGVALVASCTDTGVHRTPGKPGKPPKHTVEVQGTYCASDPETLTFPVKILFILDDSGSMGASDPQYGRLQAARDLVTELLPKDEIYFGVEKFQNGVPEMVTEPAFTRDATMLNGALANGQHTPNGCTPYAGALGLGLSTIRTDILADPVIAGRTRYVVIFLSDGEPREGATCDLVPAPWTEIISLVDSLKSLETGSPRAGQVTLHTVYLQDGGVNQNARDVLTLMAEHGAGEYKEFETGSSIDFSDLDVTAISRDYSSSFPIYATNLSTRIRREGLLVDSDADGLADVDELNPGVDSDGSPIPATDPTVADTDGDSCSDFVEVTYFKTDPTVADGICASCTQVEKTTDTDQDGLTDCEERWLATERTRADSDNNADAKPAPDNMLDFFEVTWRLGRTKYDSNEDMDLDGWDNIQELAHHMNPRANDSDMRDDFAYDYAYVNEQSGNSRCFDFRITNVHVLKTVATPGYAAGANRIYLYFVEAPQDNPYEESMIRFTEKVVDFSGSEPDPAIVRVEPDDFQIMGE